jgi:hypothetical protein
MSSCPSRVSQQHLTISSIFSHSVPHTFFGRFMNKAQCIVLPKQLSPHHSTSIAHCEFKVCHVIKYHNYYNKQYVVHASSQLSLSDCTVTKQSLQEYLRALGLTHTSLRDMCNSWHPAFELVERSLHSVRGSRIFYNKPYSVSSLLQGPHRAHFWMRVPKYLP